MHKEIKKVLIANRSVPATRIMHTCRDREIATVAVYSSSDRLASHVAMADASVHIGGASASESYLNKERLIAAALANGADAIHPGWGFLAENSDFARMVIAAGLVWIGPPPQAIEAMGDKIAAKDIAATADVPMIPGITNVTRVEQIEQWVAEEGIAYPLMIKAAAGGGGKGMVKVSNGENLELALAQAASEAMKAFGDDKMLVEKCIDPAKHIEVQIVADAHGNVLHLFERECTLQRRNQKVIEEAPSPSLSEETRQQICATAVRLMRKIGYVSAGTVEFIYDPVVEKFYFLEVNTRLQVEHGVTELITGLDIVSLMLDIAEGKEIPFRQEGVHRSGWALEARINAEDPLTFNPSFGTISRLEVPHGPGVRIYQGAYEGADIPPYYDSLFMLLMTYGQRREDAIRIMDRALRRNLRIEGVKTLAPLLLSLIGHDTFKQGDFSTRFIERFIEQSVEQPVEMEEPWGEETPRHMDELTATFTETDGEDKLQQIAKYVAKISALGPQDWM